MIIEYFYSKFLEVYDREDLGCLVWSIFRGGGYFRQTAMVVLETMHQDWLIKMEPASNWSGLVQPVF